MRLAVIGRNAIPLFHFLISAISVFGNDYFEHVYAEINANIESGDLKANFTLIIDLEEKEGFKNLDCHYKGKIYHKMGVTHYHAYQEADAIRYYEKVLDLWEDCLPVPKSELANTIYNLGLCHQYLGNTEVAKGHLDASLSIVENEAEYPLYELGLKYHGIGLFYESINDLFRAQLYFLNAVNLFEKENAVLEQFEALNSAVTLHMDFKDYDLASTYIERALGLAKAYPNLIPPQDMVPVYLNAATISFEQEEYDRSEILAKKALGIMDKETSPRLHATALEIMAFLNMERKKFGRAEELMKKVLSLTQRFDQGGSALNLMALTHENFAELYVRQGLFDKANEQLEKGFRMVAPNIQLDKSVVPNVSNIEIKNPNTLIRLLELKIRIFEARYERSNGVEWLQHSLNVQHKIDSVIKKGLLSFQFEQSKLKFLDVRFKHYGKAIQDALRLYGLTKDRYYLRQAHQFSAMTKALTLQQELNRINAMHSTVSKTILEGESALREKMNEQQSLLYEASEGNRDSLLQAFLQSQNALDAFLTTMEREEPQYYNERYRFLKTPSVRTIQDGLPDDLAVIEFFESEESIYAFWISTNTFFSKTIPLTQELKNSIERFTHQCRNPEVPVSKTDSNFIFRQLMEDGLSRSKKVKRLGIIPDGLLHTLSFEALHNGKGYLIADYAFSYAYAITLFSGKDDTNRTVSEDYVGFAASYSDSLSAKLKSKKRFFGKETLSQLMLSGKEVERASKIFGGRTFIDDRASLQNFYDYANDSRILHLSLHGLVDTDDPGRSCIVFDDSKKEFLLSPPDLYKNRLKSNLVLLSACHSANGKIYKGEGVQGMSKAFLLAGAENIFSSLWNASETSSLEITESFLRQAKDGKPLDKALQKAKLNYLGKVMPSQGHPYYWANYILLGKVEPTPSFPWPLVALIAAIVVSAAIFLRYIKRKRAQ